MTMVASLSRGHWIDISEPKQPEDLCIQLFSGVVRFHDCIFYF